MEKEERKKEGCRKGRERVGNGDGEIVKIEKEKEEVVQEDRETEIQRGEGGRESR